MTTTLTRRRLGEAARRLARRDEGLARILGDLGPPPLWSRRPGFATLARIILEQQVSLSSARAMFARISRAAGGVTPGGIAALGEPGLRALGVTRQKARYLDEAAIAIRSGRIDLREVHRMEDAPARAALMRLKGVGPWSADIYLLMALGRSDVWPAGDLALASSVRRLRRLRGAPPPDRLTEIAEAWRPWRSVAARMLWQYYLAR